MLVAILEILDSTIVNVSLPQMMGSLGANTETITWVLTSYIVSAAIFIPLTGFLVERLGRKQLLMISIIGFMLSSMACGLTNSLETMVIFRVLQGMFGAALVPVSQSVLRDTFPLHEQGKAMAVWGIGIMAAPVFGPALGGYITEVANWRWIFYINVPVCIVALIMTYLEIPKSVKRYVPIDYLGLIAMAVSVASLQFVLDQGNIRGWFDSEVIVFASLIFVVTVVPFVYRSWTNEKSVIKLKLFRDRNFAVSTILFAVFIAIVSVLMTIQPIMVEHLMNYPTMTAGLLSAPAGFASAFAMVIVSSALSKVGAKPLLIAGLACISAGSFVMSNYNLNISFYLAAWPYALEGFGMGLFFVPITAVALSNIGKNLSADASGLFMYGRMLGASIGISVFSTILTNETQINWNRLGGSIQPFSGNLHMWLHQQNLTLQNPEAIGRLATELYRQANMVAFVDVYYVLAIITACLIPFVFLLGKVDFSDPSMMH